MFKSQDIANCLEGLGAEPGDCLYLHVDYGHMRNFADKPSALIDTLQELVGPEGTLVAPAYPERASLLINYLNSNPTMDARNTPTKMGLFQEILRRRPGTLRSLHPWATTCASGAMAEQLLNEHHLDPNPFSSVSPYSKMNLSGGKIVGIGTDLNVSTYIHAVDDILSDYYPFPIYLEPPVFVNVVDWDGSSKSISALLIRQEIATCIYPMELKTVLIEKGILNFRNIEGSFFYVMEISDYLSAAVETGLSDMAHDAPPRWLREYCNKHGPAFSPRKRTLRG